MQIEDALKHLFDCEYQGRVGTLHSVAGALGLAAGRAAELLERMADRELVVGGDGAFPLTDEGRDYALRIVRIHRLWEHYLSERTGLEPLAWHDKAERLEHTTTEQEAEELSARLGHPRYDPHGDPIPTAGGEIVPRHGTALNDLRPGRLAEIVHVEDEPVSIYAQLVAAGLHPGMKVLVRESSPQRIRFDADGEEHVLAPILAANVTAVELPTGGEMDAAFENLASLSVGERARVVGFTGSCRGMERRRLLDLGLIPGTRVSAELRSPGGDPTGYRIRGAVIALRREQAERIRVEREPEGVSK